MKLDYPKSEQGNYEIAEETIGVPHPYMITPRHVTVAASKFGGNLSDEAIMYGEKHSNAHCGVKGCQLSYAEHEQAAACICHADPKDNEEEIRTYFKSIGQDLEDKGVAGIVLVDKFSVPKNKGEGDDSEPSI